MRYNKDYQKKQIVNLTGADWDEPEDNFTEAMLMEQQKLFWVPEEFKIKSDQGTWDELPKYAKDAYARTLILLTYLDTQQGDFGMPVVSRSLPERFHQRKALLTWMANMENVVHAKSYSRIFQTFLSNKERRDLWDWAKNSKTLQDIIQAIVSQYKEMDRKIFYRNEGVISETSQDYRKEQWKTMANSVFLESFLFYSGFYYSLYFYGQGKMMQSGEMINLIIR